MGKELVKLCVNSLKRDTNYWENRWKFVQENRFWYQSYKWSLDPNNSLN